MENGFLASFQTVQRNVLFRLIQYQTNRALLERVPHIRYLDMAIVFYCMVSVDSYGDGTLLIRNHHLKRWAGIRPETLCLHALTNTRKVLPAYIQTMEDVMHRVPDGLVIGGEYDILEVRWSGQAGQQTSAAGRRLQSGHFQDRSRMYVLSNEPNLYGAAAILYPKVLKRFADRLGANLYLLPGSLHEMVILPDNDRQHASELRQLVADTNRAQVSPEEVLSNEVYYYDRQEDATRIIK